MTYQVGVDLGTTWTAAAISRADGSTVLVPLGDRSDAVPSAVLVDDNGVFMIGEGAERSSRADPARVVREFKRRIGDRVPIVLDGVPTAPEALAARFLEMVLQQVAQRAGDRPTQVAVTHPAGWGPHKLGSLRAALDAHGLRGVMLLPEPQAAAIGYANAARVEPGAVVAVYDFGGGTFDAAVVRKEDGGGFTLLGRPEGIEQLGGVDIDDLVFEHVRAELGTIWSGLDITDPDVFAAVAELRRECVAAKESLSADSEVTIPVTLPGTHTRVRLDRATFEEMIRPSVEETVAVLRRAVASANLPSNTTPRLLLVGGTSRIPLVAELVAAEMGHPVSIDVDPKGVIAIGAALAARPARRPAAAPAPPPRGPAAPGVAAPVPDRPAAGATAMAGSPPPPPPPPGPAAPRPFREPEPNPGRPKVFLGVAAGAAIAAVIGGSLITAVASTGSIVPTGSPAEASTPSTAPPAPTLGQNPPGVAPPGPVPAVPAQPWRSSAPPTKAPQTRTPPTTAPTTAPPSATSSEPAPTTQAHRNADDDGGYNGQGNGQRRD